MSVAPTGMFTVSLILPAPLAVQVAPPVAKQVQLVMFAFVEVSVTFAPITFDGPALETTIV